jgi:hypothetical protein
MHRFSARVRSPLITGIVRSRRSAGRYCGTVFGRGFDSCRLRAGRGYRDGPVLPKGAP